MRAPESLARIESPLGPPERRLSRGTGRGFRRSPDRRALLDLKSCPRCVTGSRLYDPYFGEWNCIDCGYVTYDSAPEVGAKADRNSRQAHGRDDLDPLIIPTASKYQHIGTARCPWCWEALGVERWMKARGAVDSEGELARWRCDLGHFISLIEKAQSNHRDGEWLWQ